MNRTKTRSTDQRPLIVVALCAIFLVTMLVVWRSAKSLPVGTARSKREVAKSVLTKLAATAPKPSTSEIAALQAQNHPRPVDPTLVPRQQIGEARMMVSADSWQNVGLRSPANTLQTHFWAMKGGDVELLQQAIVLDDAAGAQLTTMMDALPRDEREKFQSPEQLAAFLMCGTSNVRGYVLTNEERAGRTSTLTVLTSQPDGTGRFKGRKQELRLQPDGTWRVAVSNRMVSDWARLTNANGR